MDFALEIPIISIGNLVDGDGSSNTPRRESDKINSISCVKIFLLRLPCITRYERLAERMFTTKNEFILGFLPLRYALAAIKRSGFNLLQWQCSSLSSHPATHQSSAISQAMMETNAIVCHVDTFPTTEWDRECVFKIGNNIPFGRNKSKFMKRTSSLLRFAILKCIMFHVSRKFLLHLCEITI